MRILLADDHKLLRDALHPLLSKVHAQVQVVEADNFPDAVAAADAIGGVELALLDLRMPGMDGLAGLRRFMERFPAARVVLLSAFGEPDTVLAAIKAGAAGFIPKTIGGRGFVNALRLIMSGEVYVPGNTLLEAGEQWTNTPIPPPPPIPTVNATPPAPDIPATEEEDFSEREHAIMALLVDGLPNKVIARQLGLQEPTVKARLRSLYRKIGAVNRAQAVRIILTSGKR